MNYIPDLKSRFRILKGGKISLVVSALVAGSTISFASPTGGIINTGSATISQIASVTNIDQSTQRASINWQSFSIAPTETVTFNQPNSSAVTLNRVVGNETSLINGALHANGQVWILNSNGILFGQGASVNTAGLVASTMNITDQNFMNGKYTFESTESTSRVINMGTIHVTDGRYVALLGKEVANTGLIQATKGTVALSGGDKVSLNFNGDSLLGIAIDQGTLNALVENKGAIIADGGNIFLTTKAANDLIDGVVNNTGLLQAQTLDDITGHIEVYAHSGTANVGGTLDTSAPISGNGGFIETSGATVNLDKDVRINASSVNGKGGQWLLDPYDYTIDASAASTIVGSLNAGTSVTISTANASSAGISGISATMGDITVASAIAKTAGGDATLTLQAANTIAVNAPISSTVGKLNVSLLADNDNGTHNGTGIVILNDSITTNGGNINFGDGATRSINGVSTKVGGDVYVGGSSAQSLTTNGGAITVNGEMILANPSGLTISSTGGDVTFGGLLNSGNSYASVAYSDTWTNALAAAASGTGAGVGDTYLVTITSRLENAVAGRVGNYVGAWLGAKRDLTNTGTAAYTWHWLGGPEGLMNGGTGLAFFQQNTGGSSGTAINGQYNNFGSGEPNGTGSSGESAAQFFGTAGQWNDLTATSPAGSSGQYGVSQYIKETNLAASSLTINAGSGTVTFNGAAGNNKALSSLNVNAGAIVTNGIKTDGIISLETTTGNINVAGNIVSASTASNAILLNAGKDASAGTASDGDIVVSNGSTFTTGSGGKATLYTGSVTGSTNLAGSGTSVGVGNSRYNSDEVASNFSTAIGGSGIYAIYREQPTISITAVDQSKTYDKQVYSGANNANSSGFVNGDTSSILSGGITGYGGTATSATAAGTYTIAPTGDYSNELGYAISYTNGHLTINKKDLTASYTTQAKTYDGTTSATIDASSADIISGDTVTIAETGTFSDKNAGTGKTVAISDGALNGADAANYNFTNATTTIYDGVINKKDLTASYTTQTKTYDGTTSATIDASSADIVSGDSVTIAETGTFSDKNVGTGKTVTISNGILSGLDEVNYNLTNATATTTGDITKATLNIGGTITASDKIYDGTTSATVDGSGATFTTFGSDNVAISSAGTFDTQNVGIGKEVTAALGGADASNYQIGTAPIITAAIKENMLMNNVITTSVNNIAIQPSLMDINANPTTGIVVSRDMMPVTSRGFTEGTLVDLVSKPLEGEVTQSLSLSDVQAMQEFQRPATTINSNTSSDSTQEVHVALSHENSIIDLVNGGVKLPQGVEQEFYIINVAKKGKK